MRRLAGLAAVAAGLAGAIAQSARITRPTYHQTPPQGWMNDPVIFFDGTQFHNFYQANPVNVTPPWAPGGSLVWGHATTTDWTTWEDQGPLVLSAGEGTGSVLRGPTATFPTATAVRAFPGCGGLGIGVANDSQLLSWTDTTPCPAITTPPAPANASYVGDPFLVRDADGSFSLFAGSSQGDAFKGGLPEILRFRSPDLHTWTFAGAFFVGNAAAGPRAECPRFFAASVTQQVLLYSVPNNGSVVWLLGAAAPSPRTDFAVQATGVVDWGSFYAAYLFQDAAGAPHVAGWLQELRPLPTQDPTSWFGALSLPRALLFAADQRRLGFAPSSWVVNERSFLESFDFTLNASANSTLLPLAVINSGTTLWLHLAEVPCSGLGGGRPRTDDFARDPVVPARAPALQGGYRALVLADGPGDAGDEFVRIEVAAGGRSLVVDTTQSSLDPTVPGRIASLHPQLPTTTAFASLDIFTDANIVEVFGNTDLPGDVVYSTRAYPTEVYSHGVWIQWTGASPSVCVHVDTYSMPGAPCAPGQTQCAKNAPERA